MPHESIVAMHVTDPAGYAAYRAQMTPIRAAQRMSIDGSGRRDVEAAVFMCVLELVCVNGRHELLVA